MARYSVIPASAVVDSRLSLRELSVLAAIGIHTDRNGWCYPSSERLGEMLGVSGGMVRQSVAALARCGYVQIVKRSREDGGQTSNAIRILMDAEHPSEAMRFGLDPSDPVHPPVSPELTPPVSSGLTPPVSSGLTRKPPVESPTSETTSPQSGRSRKPSKRQQAMDYQLPDWIDRARWQAWIAERTKPDAGLDLNIEKLAQWRAEGHDPNQILREAAASGWQGLFLPSSMKTNGVTNGNQPTDPRARRRDESLADWSARICRIDRERALASEARDDDPALGTDGRAVSHVVGS